MILVGSSGALVSVNAKTGVIDRRMSLGAPAIIGPIASGGIIYVVADNGQLIALR